MRNYCAAGIVLLFVGLAVSPSLYATGDSVYPLVSLDRDIIDDCFDSESYNPVHRVVPRVNTFRYYISLQAVESRDGIVHFFECDDELQRMYEQLAMYDCDCLEDTFQWDRKWVFWIPCLMILPFFIVAVGWAIWLRVYLPVYILGILSLIFNCPWVHF